MIKVAYVLEYAPVNNVDTMKSFVPVNETGAMDAQRLKIVFLNKLIRITNIVQTILPLMVAQKYVQNWSKLKMSAKKSYVYRMRMSWDVKVKLLVKIGLNIVRKIGYVQFNVQWKLRSNVAGAMMLMAAGNQMFVCH